VVIDKLVRRFLELICFAGRAPGTERSRVWAPAAIGVVLLLPGCSLPSHKATDHAPTNDLTSGHITMVCSPDARTAIERGRTEIVRLYPDAQLEVANGTSRDAVAALFGARADLAVISRELVPEERRAAVQGRLGIDGYRFARDAAVLLVNPRNVVDNVTLDEVRKIYGGELRNWSELGGTGPIEPIVPAVGSDLMESFSEDVMAGEPIQAKSLTAQSDSDAVRLVLENPGAIGIVTLGAVARGGKALPLAALRGLPYYAPDPETVHDGRYPVTRFYNLYSRSSGPALVNGFITFITSREGQAIVQQSGLVPTSVPVRFVHRSPMLGSHSQGDSVRTP